MTEKLSISFKGETYQFNIIRSNSNIERVDFLLQPGNPASGAEKKLINANELWFTWRNELKQFFTTNLKIALDPELFQCFSNAIMKHYLYVHSGNKQKAE
jgi:hypothetical protein